MNVTLYQAAAALNAAERWQELSSENLSSSSIPGFKKQDMSFSAIEAGVMASGQAGGSSQKFLLPTLTSSTDFSPGQMKYTGSKTDLAIDGTGFFEVQLPNGKIGYTRDGEFQINAQDQMTTKEGFVVNTSGGSIHMDRKSSAPLTISSNGTVSQGANSLGKLKLVDFNDNRLLERVTGGYYVASNPSVRSMDAPSTTTVRQGYVETSNTNPITEMVNLIAAMRNYESNQKIIQMQDDRIGKLIADVANPS